MIIHTFLHSSIHSFTYSSFPSLHLSFQAGRDFFLSLEDDIFKIFGADKMSGKGILIIITSFLFKICFLFFFTFMYDNHFPTCFDISFDVTEQFFNRSTFIIFVSFLLYFSHRTFISQFTYVFIYTFNLFIYLFIYSFIYLIFLTRHVREFPSSRGHAHRERHRCYSPR